MTQQANTMSISARSTHTLRVAVITLCLGIGATLPLSITLATPVNEAVSPTSSPEQLHSTVRSQDVQVASTALTLDLDSLSERLRESEAIGLFAKLALKKKFDELIEQVANFHKGDNSGSLQLLRGDYEHLMAHTLDLLHEGDAELYRDLSASKEALWNALTNATQFVQLCRMDTVCDVELVASLR